MHLHAGGTIKSEFEKRAVYISTEESHVFYPVMERCLEENPQVRGTFEEVIVLLQKYSKSKLDEVNMQEIDQHLMTYCISAGIRTYISLHIDTLYDAERD